jgi:hypothetical protein
MSATSRMRADQNDFAQRFRIDLIWMYSSASDGLVALT